MRLKRIYQQILERRIGTHQKKRKKANRSTSKLTDLFYSQQDSKKPFGDHQMAGPLIGSTLGSPRLSTLESLMSFLGHTVAHRPQLSHLV